ncbi:hypothetical protein SAMN04490248_1553 [Salinihabitans flavidus]|uniref:Uncharacterized protein n=1 Tax=Salinihabitans flavidus TaxID=569882 RepID=A0A1H8WCD4_9RHOB|nr:hypothetical protein [Salinihabitans flavidus]SEP25291.1 hypothetical protein SAMN04490248_1553 [Salinihabitans flavidus]
MTAPNEPNSERASPGFFTRNYWKALAVKLRDKWIEEWITFVVTSGIVAAGAGVLGYLGYRAANPDYPPAYNENAAQNPDGPFHFMPMVQYARKNLGYEVQFDPIIEPNTVAITYPEALSVQKIRGDVFSEFHKKYPHCLIFERRTIQSPSDDQDPKVVVTIKLNELAGPTPQSDDPRLFYRCEKIEE